MSTSTRKWNLLKPLVATGLLAGLTYTIWLVVEVGTETPRVPPATSPISGPGNANLLPADVDTTGSPERIAAESVNPSAVGAPDSLVEPPNDAGKPANVAGRLAPVMDSVAASFLTDLPDLPGFDQVVRELAQVAEVDTDSVYVDKEDGSVHGRLSIEGADIEASFQISGDRYRVAFEVYSGEDLTPPFSHRDMSISFLNEAGIPDSASAVIQHHPDPLESASNHLQEGVERYVGWTLAINDQGTRALPISMNLGGDGASWIIGHSPTLFPIEDQWANDTSAYALWLSKLHQFAP